MGKFNNSKSNFKELGKDLVGVGVSVVSTVVDVVMVPVCLCRDFRAMYVNTKAKQKQERELKAKSKSKVAKVEIVEAAA